MYEPITEEEIRNGWDQESLSKYRRERNRQQAIKILSSKPPPKRNVQNHKDNPLKWRK